MKYVSILFLAVLLAALPSLGSVVVDNPTDTSGIESDITELQGQMTTVQNRSSANSSDIDRNENNILANGFRISVQGDLVAMDYDDGWLDQFEDQLGVDTADGSNFTYDASGDYYSYSDAITAFGVSNIFHVKFEDSNATAVVVNDGTNNTSFSMVGGNTEDHSGAGKIDKAIIYNNTDVGVKATPGETLMSSMTEGSVSWWAYLDTAGDTGMIWSWQDESETLGYMQHIHTANDIKFRMYSGGWILRFERLEAPFIDTWTHFVYTTDSSGMKMYVNGADDTHNWTWTTGSSNSTLWVSSIANVDGVSIGYCNNANADKFWFDGKVDDWRMHPTALTPEQVLLLYKGGSGTQDGNPSTGGTMELICTNGVAVADSAPTESRLMILHEATSGTPTLNTDIKAYSSSDAGTTWDTVTLENIGELSSGIDILAGTNALTGASTNMEWRIVTDSASNQGRFHGASIIWK